MCIKSSSPSRIWYPTVVYCFTKPLPIDYPPPAYHLLFMNHAPKKCISWEVSNQLFLVLHFKE